MFRLMLLIGTGVLLLWSPAAPAQDNELPRQSAAESLLRSAAEVNTMGRPKPELRMYEDIEIMRRILEKELRRVALISWENLPALTGKSTDKPKPLDVFANLDADLDLDNDRWPDVYLHNPSGAQDLIWGHEGIMWNRYRDLTGKAHPHASVYPSEIVEGYYLKGQGIVFSAALTILHQDSVKPSTLPAVKPMTEWERVRKEIHGEKIEAAPQSSPKKQDSLTDVIVKALAENGHHFFQLPESESVTVAVTIRRGQECTVCHATNALRGPRSDSSGSPLRDPTAPQNAILEKHGTFNPKNPNSATKGGHADFGDLPFRIGAPQDSNSATGSVFSEVSGANRAREQGKKTESQNLILLGDLQMKQGRFKEATATYQKAYEDLQWNPSSGSTNKPLPDPGDGDDKVQQQVSALEVAAKWAQASLAAGNQDDAFKAFKKITDNSSDLDAAAKKWMQARGRAVSKRTQGANAPVLPGKLIVSAPKKLMDDFGAGKITFEEFKKGVSVQRLNFNSP